MSRASELEALLREHSAADAVERRHRDRMLSLLQATADPFSRSSFSPGHFTASGFVLSADAGALLLIHHKKLGRWLQPGGHIEPEDASVIEAARRELREEVGLERLSLARPAVFDLDVHAIPALGHEPAHEHFDVRMLFRAEDALLRPGSDAGAARFVPLHEICAIESDESVMRAVRKLQALAQANAAQR
jgi:8-oxo-dGTP pyrophosphatase MutT (NUDIX family)